MNLLTVIAYHAKDAELTQKLLERMIELQGGMEPMGSVLLAADDSVPLETKKSIHETAKRRFWDIETMLVAVPIQQQGWPVGANRMFHDASRQVEECYRLPFLWLEPDCVPLVPSWFETIQEQYGRCPKRFMGCIVNANQANVPKVSLSGVAVYPNNAWSLLKKFCAADQTMAWDMAGASVIVPRAQHTPLIQHFWGEVNLPPTFTSNFSGPRNALTLESIQPQAVIFHRCKDGSLIELLRNANGNSTSPTEVNPSMSSETEPIIDVAPLKKTRTRERTNV